MSPTRLALSNSVLALCLALSPSCCHAQSATLPEYTPSHQVSGTIHVWGSPQMGDLLRFYETGFHKFQPAVQFDTSLKSTLTAVSGVYAGRADIGLLGREIWPTETQAFASIQGHLPTVIEVATGSYDVPKATFALMIFVPRANPLASLSMQQLARIFAAPNPSATPITTWGQLGLTGAWVSRPIHLYGFDRDNDKSLIFRRLVFRHGERWSCALHEFSNAPGSNATDAGELILRAVAADPDAIGISNIHYAPSAVRALPLSTAAHPAPVAPTRDTVAGRTYPLTRAVFMVVDPSALHTASSSATTEFLRFVLSRQGQQAVAQEGNYLPLTAGEAAAQRRQLPTP